MSPRSCRIGSSGDVATMVAGRCWCRGRDGDEKMRMGSSHDPNPHFFFPLKRREGRLNLKPFSGEVAKQQGMKFSNILGILVNYEANSMEVAWGLPSAKTFLIFKTSQPLDPVGFETTWATKKHPACLGYIGDYTTGTQFYGGYNIKPLQGYLLNKPVY